MTSEPRALIEECARAAYCAHERKRGFRPRPWRRATPADHEVWVAVVEATIATWVMRRRSALSDRHADD